MIEARTILNYTEDEIWDLLPEGHISVQFEDGIVETTRQDTILSWYLWDHHRHYPDAPLLCRHHLSAKYLGNSSHLDVLGRIMYDVHVAYDGKVDREHMWYIGQMVSNRYYNETSNRLEDCVTTQSILDYLEIVNHPEVEQILKKMAPTEQSISWAYEEVGRIIKHPDNFPDNCLADDVKAGLLQNGQVLQVIVSRGFTTDTDSNIFQEPIQNGFIRGVRDLADNLKESRSASKALIYATDPLQTSEYTNRRLQLAAATLKNLHFGDCGSQRTLKWHVNVKDLPFLDGKFYKTDNGLVAVRKSDRHLVGKTLHLRSTLFCDRLHNDSYGVCSTCYGELSFSVPDATNLGWVVAVELCEQITQLIMSTKHHDGSATVDDIILSDYERNFIRSLPGETCLWLHKSMMGKKVSLVLEAQSAKDLTAVNYTKDVGDLMIQNVTELPQVKLIVDDGKNVVDAIVSTSMGKRLGSLTHDALRYLKEHGWSLTDDGDYLIDLTNWDFEKALFELPLKHVNMVDYVATITSMLIGGEEKKTNPVNIGIEIKPLQNYPSAEEALMAFYTLVTNKMKTNLALLETLLLSLSARNPAAGDYALPGPGEPVLFGSFKDLMAKRSISAWLAYESQRKALYDPASFLTEYRPSHPMDDCFLG